MRCPFTTGSPLSCRCCPVLLIGTARNDLEGVIRQGSLQRLRLIQRRAHPHVVLLLCRQDRRHRLGMDRLNDRVRRGGRSAAGEFGHGLSASNRRMSSESRSTANNNARAGASGVLRCCSQSRKVVMGRWNASANSTWVIPRRCRSTLTRGSRRIFGSSSGMSGFASGSDSAAATTCISRDVKTRQSVSPPGSGSPGFTSTRVVPLLLMSCSLYWPI